MPSIVTVGRVRLRVLICGAVIMLAIVAASRWLTQPSPRKEHILNIDVSEEAPIAVRQFAERLRNGSGGLALCGYRVSDAKIFAQMAVVSYRKRGLENQAAEVIRYYQHQGVPAEALVLDRAEEGVERWLNPWFMMMEQKDKDFYRKVLRMLLAGPSEEDVLEAHLSLAALLHRRRPGAEEFRQHVEAYVRQGRLPGQVTQDEVHVAVREHFRRKMTETSWDSYGRIYRRAEIYGVSREELGAPPSGAPPAPKGQ